MIEVCACPFCERALPPGFFRFDAESGIAVSDRRFATMPRREARILEILIERNGRAISKIDLFERVYRGDDEPEEMAVVESHVSKLRKRLVGLPLTIHSERFKGYWLTWRAA